MILYKTGLSLIPYDGVKLAYFLHGFQSQSLAVIHKCLVFYIAEFCQSSVSWCPFSKLPILI